MSSDLFSTAPDASAPLSRRRFVQGLATGGAVAGLGLWPKFSQAQPLPANRNVLSGTSFDLTIGETPVNFTGRTRTAITVNGSLPAPHAALARGHDGRPARDATRCRPAPSTAHAASIHWHGILLPANMDGVPGLSFDGIHRGETYHYRFDVRQAGTYWYHSHSAFQEQAGLYGRARHRSARTGALRVRPRLRGDADRLDRSGSGRAVRAPEEDVGLRQPTTSARSATSCATSKRTGLSATLARPADVGRDAHDADRPVGRQRATPTPT